MTPKELRDLADKIERENIVVKKGYLKMDLYNFHSDSYHCLSFKESWGDFWLYNKKQKEDFIQDFISRFDLVLPEGTEFVCYLVDGKETWYDNIKYGVEEVDEKWAKKYLRDIVDVIPEA